MKPATRSWVKRWVVGELSPRRFLTGALFIYGSLALFAWLFGERLMFRPHPAGYADAAGTLKLASTGGARITARDAPPKALGGRVVLYSHGNAEDLGDLDRLMAPFTQLGLGVVAYDYQGYGTSEGTPTEAHLEDDILAAYRYVTETRGVAPSRVIVYGRSIGSGPSVWLASTHEVGALVLESAFTSPFRVATRVRLLPWDPFPNLERLPSVRCPVLVMHAIHDRLIPLAHAEANFAAITAPKRSFFSPRGGHGDMPIAAGPAYVTALAAFVDPLPRD